MFLDALGYFRGRLEGGYEIKQIWMQQQSIHKGYMCITCYLGGVWGSGVGGILENLGRTEEIR